MAEYWYTRIGILGALSIFYWFVLQLFADPFAGWTGILITTTIVGFSHYFVGGYYQLQSFHRADHTRKRYLWFTFLALLALGVSGGFLWSGQIALFAFLSIGYFMIHGFFNEITLYERQTGYKANRYSIAALAFSLAGIIFLACAHANSLFDPHFQYLLRDDYIVQLYLERSLFPVLGLYLGIGCLVAAIGSQLVAVVQSCFQFWHLLAWLAVVALAILMIVVYPPSYVHLLSGLLLYHFIVWFVFYFRQFQQRSRTALHRYLLIHIGVLVPFLVLALPGPAFSLVELFLLNSYVFLTLTTIHVTTSFMSETWFQRWALRADK